MSSLVEAPSEVSKPLLGKSNSLTGHRQRLVAVDKSYNASKEADTDDAGSMTGGAEESIDKSVVKANIGEMVAVNLARRR